MTFEKFTKLPQEKQDLILSVGIKEFSQKSYNDVKTDIITQKCGISKGILFHYFGSKKEFYGYCLSKSMERLVTKTDGVVSADFYEILFENMNRKISVCMKYKDEMHMVNMASRDAAVEIAQIKAEILAKYKITIRAESAQMLSGAVNTLKLKPAHNNQKQLEGLYIYINALMNKYLLMYQETPDVFFENSENIKKEMKIYLDMMLYGICQ